MGTLRPPYQQKYFFRPIGAFFKLKLKVTKIPIQNRPFSAAAARAAAAASESPPRPEETESEQNNLPRRSLDHYQTITAGH